VLSPGATTTVLHVTQPVTEGVGNYVGEVVAAQVALGFRVGLACPDDSELARSARQAGAEVLPWAASRQPGPSVLSEIRRLRRALARFKPDLVHLHSSKAGMAGRLAIHGTLPTVFQPHAWSFEAASLLRPVARRWERVAGSWADAIVTVSEEEQAQARAAGITPVGFAATVPNPIDLDRFHSAVELASGTDDRSGPVRRSLGLGGKPMVLCVGRLCRQKGQDLLVDSWPRVAEAVPGAQLVLVGDGPDAARLAKRRTADIHLLGVRRDVPALLAEADVVAMPSRWEGMSLAMLEALAAGKPVVISDVGGAAETVGQGAGAIVDIGDTTQLSWEISRRLLDRRLREEEGQRGREIVRANHHSLEATVTALQQVYERVLARRGRRRHGLASHGAGR